MSQSKEFMHSSVSIQRKVKKRKKVAFGFPSSLFYSQSSYLSLIANSTHFSIFSHHYFILNKNISKNKKKKGKRRKRLQERKRKEEEQRGGVWCGVHSPQMTTLCCQGKVGPSELLSSLTSVVSSLVSRHPCLTLSSGPAILSHTLTHTVKLSLEREKKEKKDCSDPNENSFFFFFFHSFSS